MSKERKFTHDEVILVAGEYYRSKETLEWVSENEIEDWSDKSLMNQIAVQNEYEQDRYY